MASIVRFLGIASFLTSPLPPLGSLMGRHGKQYLQVMGSLRLIHGPASLLVAPGLLKCSLVQKGRSKSLLEVCWFVRKQPRTNLPPILARPVRLPLLLEYSRLTSLSPNISTCRPQLWHLGQGLWNLYVWLTSSHFDLAPYPVTEHIELSINRP